jgi:hypothetical protein
MLQNLRIVPTNDTAVVLSSTVFPQFFSILASPVFVNAPFLDGPYLDFQGTANANNPGNGNDAETGTASARTGTITFTPAATTFDANDIGRQIRLFNEPPAWSSATTYNYGDIVTYNGEYWRSIASGVYAANNVNVFPGDSVVVGNVQVTVWAPALSGTGGFWAWGTITTQATTSCTIALKRIILPGNSLTISAFSLGVYKIGQYPTCGIYYEGRLFLGGAVPNRWDASMSNLPLIFSPSDSDGLVEDANAIAYTMVSDDPQLIYWMKQDHKGLLVGTKTGEWLIASSSLGEALTPTSAKATQETKYGSAFVEPVRTGMSLVFVHRYGQRLLEYLPLSAFASGYSSRHINEYAKHLSASGIAEVAYQEEKVPTIWCRMIDGTLAGVAYRRVSPYMTEAPIIEGWHRAALGGGYDGTSGRRVFSMANQPGEDLLSDVLYVCTVDANNAHCWIEALRPIYEDA